MRTYCRLHVRLSKGDREKLNAILSGGVQAVRTVLRALALCRLNEGRSASQVAAEVRLTSKAVREIGRRYEDGGWSRRSTSGRGPAPPQCSTPARNNASLPWSAANRPRAAPAGPCGWWSRKRLSGGWWRKWAARLFGFCCCITTSSRGGKKKWCVAGLNEDYITRMEEVLAKDEKRYDRAEPVVCLDEKPVTLHADVRPLRAAVPGPETRRDNEYKRCGTANVFCAVEPKAGRHFTFPTPDRSGGEFARVSFE